MSKHRSSSDGCDQIVIAGVKATRGRISTWRWRLDGGNKSWLTITA